MSERGGCVDTYETLNEVLVKLFNDIMAIEEKAIICLLYTSRCV